MVFVTLESVFGGGFVIDVQVGELFTGDGEGVEKCGAGFWVAIGLGVALHFLNGGEGEERCTVAANVSWL